MVNAVDCRSLWRGVSCVNMRLPPLFLRHIIVSGLSAFVFDYRTIFLFLNTFLFLPYFPALITNSNILSTTLGSSVSAAKKCVILP